MNELRVLNVFVAHIKCIIFCELEVISLCCGYVNFLFLFVYTFSDMTKLIISENSYKIDTISFRVFCSLESIK